MSGQLETRFICDRCKTEIHVPMQNTPVEQRVRGGDGWTAFWINETTSPAKHLCEECSIKFVSFLSAPSRPA